VRLYELRRVQHDFKLLRIVRNDSRFIARAIYHAFEGFLFTAAVSAMMALNLIYDVKFDISDRTYEIEELILYSNAILVILSAVFPFWQRVALILQLLVMFGWPIETRKRLAARAKILRAES
jgi:hypothetical protein